MAVEPTEVMIVKVIATPGLARVQWQRTLAYIRSLPATTDFKKGHGSLRR